MLDKSHILAHRGIWRQSEDQNTKKAFQLALEQGFGIETDIRDSLEQLVISHDIPTGTEMSLSDFIAIIIDHDTQSTLALNIKSDGLAKNITSILSEAPLTNYFLFDMSVPDIKSYIYENLPFFTRVSEEEKSPAFRKQANGVWLDSFVEEGVNLMVMEKYLDIGKKVCIVSPELHNYDYRHKWGKLKSVMKTLNQEKLSNIYLCTDFPNEAWIFFNMQ